MKWQDLVKELAKAYKEKKNILFVFEKEPFIYAYKEWIVVE